MVSSEIDGGKSSVQEWMMAVDQHDMVDPKQILTGSRWHWNVSAPFYDFLHSISFGEDGDGEMVYGYTQVVRILVKFKYELTGHGQLYFEYLDTFDNGRHMFAPSADNRFRQVGLEIAEGRHERVIESWDGHGILTCRYALRFDREPFPERFQPNETDLTYYGWPLGNPQF